MTGLLTRGSSCVQPRTAPAASSRAPCPSVRVPKQPPHARLAGPDRARSDGRRQRRLLRKPMCHTNEEWWKAKKAIADGIIGNMIMSQGSYHRNSIEGEWNWPIEAGAGPDGKGDDFVDWNMWLGSQWKQIGRASCRE